MENNPTVVILAGGYGTRIREYPHPIAKPMVPVGGKPILWHIMKGYAHYGFNNFIVCLGFRGETIRDYFLNFKLNNDDVTLDLGKQSLEVVNGRPRDEDSWKVTLIDTGQDTLTGGRIKRIEKYIESDTFFITYGDGLSDINFSKQLAFHKEHGGEVTVSGVQQYSRFGHIETDGENKVTTFTEKPLLSEVVSGGFFVCEKRFLKRLTDDNTVLESEPLMSATKDQSLFCYPHRGFWACMDTYRDYEYLNALYTSKESPWVVWNK